jgi:hypothetical protein
MTCRHAANDPSCSSHRDYVAPQSEEPMSTTPDSEKYEIVEAERVGKHLVLKVHYPNCKRCAYEGNKVMVFFNVSETDALKWRRIDPHFRASTYVSPDSKKGAPSPAARFPASPEGWKDAIDYAERKR